MDKQISEVLQDRHESHILPFMWMKGEGEELIRREMGKIASCGIDALCLESRPHPDFCGPGWWHDVDIVLDEAKKRGMKVWFLDDVHFPTGLANGLLEEKYPERAKQYLAVHCFDVTGPLSHVTLRLGAAMERRYTWADVRNPNMQETPLRDEKQLVSAVAMRLTEGDTVRADFAPARQGQGGDAVQADFAPAYQGRGEDSAQADKKNHAGCSAGNADQNMMVLTDQLQDGNVTIDIPEGVWRIFAVYTTYEGGGAADYINLIDPDSVRVLIEAVYEPHYERYKEEFGNTIAGFFSDEPGFGNTVGYDMDEALGRRKMVLPWSREAGAMLRERLGEDWAAMLPLLWYPSEDGAAAARVRYAYMDSVTKLAAAHFSGQLGAWCVAHGVEYIGHIIEDNNIHSRLGCGEGHYFRAMSGQAMAGIDEIGGQILPGNPDTTRHEYIDFDGPFFHYMLPKMGASAALMQPAKKGRLLCEMFGTYGFGLGVRDMKWIADFMIARGVNYLVPHAFSMGEYPDTDCPPHFYAGGKNPQFPYFARLMCRLSRLCHVFSGGRWVPEVGLIYHGEMDWMDACMPDQVPARLLHEGHIDYAIVPADALAEAAGDGDGTYCAYVKDGCLMAGGVRLKILIVPESRYADPKLLRFMEAFPEVRVLFVGRVPEAVIYSGQEMLRNVKAVPLDQLVSVIQKMGVVGARADVKGNAVFYHYEKESGDLWMVFNESLTEPIHGNILVKPGGENRRVYRYDAMKNKVFEVEQIEAFGFDKPRMLCTLELAPCESAVFFTAAPDEVPYVISDDPNDLWVRRESDISCQWEIALAEAADEPEFVSLEEMIRRFEAHGGSVSAGAKEAAAAMHERLSPVSDILPAFSGYMRYTRQIEIRNPKKVYAVEVQHLYEAGRIFVNETETDMRLCPPYRFELEGLKEGTNTITIEVVNTALRDALNRKGQAPGHEAYILEPSGMFGCITLLEMERH